MCVLNYWGFYLHQAYSGRKGYCGNYYRTAARHVSIVITSVGIDCPRICGIAVTQLCTLPLSERTYIIGHQTTKRQRTTTRLAQASSNNSNNVKNPNKSKIPCNHNFNKANEFSDPSKPDNPKQL